MARKKRSTISGVPVNFARRSSRWVAIPVGHVSRWHWRAMSQPSATSADVPNANSSAPSSAATSRSRPGLETAVGAQRDAVAQAVAEQHLVDLGQPELPGGADVLDRRQRATPRSRRRGRDRWMYAAPAFATPAAIVPTPRDATSFTPIRALGLIARRSAMSWARSSIE